LAAFATGWALASIKRTDFGGSKESTAKYQVWSLAQMALPEANDRKLKRNVESICSVSQREEQTF
jgi:hypothetical protein